MISNYSHYDTADEIIAKHGAWMALATAARDPAKIRDARDDLKAAIARALAAEFARGYSAAAAHKTPPEAA